MAGTTIQTELAIGATDAAAGHLEILKSLSNSRMRIKNPVNFQMIVNLLTLQYPNSKIYRFSDHSLVRSMIKHFINNHSSVHLY